MPSDTTGRNAGQSPRLVEPGEFWDPALHHGRCKPPGRARTVESLATHEVSAVLAPDGTRYCAFCLRCLAAAGERSRRHICDDCVRLRKTHIQRMRRHPEVAADADVAQDVPEARIRVMADGRQIVEIPAELLTEMFRAHDGVQAAISRASATFRRSERGTWQHNLLLKSKTLHVAMDELRRDLREDAQRLARDRESGPVRVISPGRGGVGR